jgi:hypothetical protein
MRTRELPVKCMYTKVDSKVFAHQMVQKRLLSTPFYVPLGRRLGEDFLNDVAVNVG